MPKRFSSAAAVSVSFSSTRFAMLSSVRRSRHIGRAAPAPFTISSLWLLIVSHSDAMSSSLAGEPSGRTNGSFLAALTGSMRLPMPVVTSPFTSRYIHGMWPSYRVLNEKK